MAYKNRTTGNIFSNNSDANARAWVQFISNGLTSAGQTKTADTGQINTATFTAPVAGNAVIGYEIREFTDTLAATFPIKYKLEYASGGTAATPALWLTVGKGSNAAGTITDIIFPRTQIQGSSVTTASEKFALSGDTNRCTVGMVYTATSGGLILGIERTKNAAGADSSDGALVVLTTTLNAGANWAFCPFSGTIPPIEALGNCLIPSSGTTAVGANVGIFPPIFFWFGENVNANLNFYGYRTTEILTDTEITATVYGQTRGYLTTGILSSLFATSRNSNALMMRFEN